MDLFFIQIFDLLFQERHKLFLWRTCMQTCASMQSGTLLVSSSKTSILIKTWTISPSVSLKEMFVFERERWKEKVKGGLTVRY